MSFLRTRRVSRCLTSSPNPRYPLSPLEQEQLLEQTRAQIRQQVAEITELARTSRNGVEFFREFLARTVAALNGQGGAIWLPGETRGECQLIAEVNFASSAYHESERQRRDLNRVLGETIKNRRAFIIGAGSSDASPLPPGQPAGEEIANTTPYPMFLYPGALGREPGRRDPARLAARGGATPKTYPTLVTFLNSVCVHATSFLKARQGELAISRNQEYEHMLRCLGDLNGELDPAKVGRNAVNHFTDLFNASRCSLFHQAGGHWRLEQVSNQKPSISAANSSSSFARWRRGCRRARRPGRSRSTHRSKRRSGPRSSPRSAPGRSPTPSFRVTRTRDKRT